MKHSTKPLDVMYRQVCMGQLQYLEADDHCLCGFPFGLRGQLHVGSLWHWVEYCPECEQTFRVGDGIPPKGTPMLDPDDPYGPTR